MLNIRLVPAVRHYALTLLVATLLAFSVFSASIWLDNLTGATLTPAALACTHQGGTCG